MTRLLTENAAWKLSAIVISATLWYAFVGETEVAASVPITVQFKNVPRDLEMSAEQMDRLFVRLRGPATRLNTSTLNQVTLMLDLADVEKPGEHTFNIGPGNLQLPAGVHVGRVAPSQFRLQFHKRMAREVPVEVRYAGPPPPGYRISSEHVSPPQVRVMGPEGRVVELTSAQTDAIDLSNVVGHSEFRVPAFLPDPQVRFDGAPPLISVRVSLEKIPQ